MNVLDQALIAAAWRNDLAEANRLIAAGADVNAKDETIQSAFLIATSEGYVDLLTLTLEHGADVGAKDSYNGTGLIRAADRGHAEIIGILLQAGIEVDHVNTLGWTALHEAIILGTGESRYVDCVRLLLAAGADPQLPSARDGTNPETHARIRGFHAIATTIRRVIEQPPMDDANAALDAAMLEGDADGVVAALRAGGIFLAQGMNGRSGRSRHADCARLLALISRQAQSTPDA